MLAYLFGNSTSMPTRMCIEFRMPSKSSVHEAEVYQPMYRSVRSQSCV